MNSGPLKDLTVLLDKLAEETKKFTTMLIAGTNSGEEFHDCERTVRQLQSEIEARNEKKTVSFNLQGMIFWDAV